MTKQERLRSRRLVRFAIPAVVCLVAIVAVAVGTKFWQAASSNPAQAMQLGGAWLGMRLSTTDSVNAQALGVPPTVKGVVVADVQASSRAVLAGLAPGDVLTRVDGNEVDGLMDLLAVSRKLDAGQQFQVDFLRAGRPMAAIIPAAEPAGAGATQWNNGWPVASPAPGAGQWNAASGARPCVNCPTPIAP